MRTYYVRTILEDEKYLQVMLENKERLETLIATYQAATGEDPQVKTISRLSSWVDTEIYILRVNIKNKQRDVKRSQLIEAKTQKGKQKETKK